MKELLDFYENMNEIVYVSDIKTYEVIYMNRVAREMYGLHSMEELKGKKCYELIQGNSCPCEICNNQALRCNYFEEWRYHNPVLNKPFMLKDSLIRVNGRDCRIELAIDVSAQEQQNEIIQEYANNESILNRGLQLSLSTDLPEKSLSILLEYVGISLKCDRIYIFEEKDGCCFDNTYEWCAKDVIPQKDNLQNIPSEVASIWLKYFQSSKNVIIENLDDIRESDPMMYECLKPQDIHSLVVSPLIFSNKLIGFFGVDNPPQKLLSNISTLFMIMGHFIVSLIRRRDLIKRLENLSYHDQLTGLRNRYAMSDYTESLDPSRSIGIVNCDVTGLKKVNDTLGHQAGDDLLVRACKCLQKAFPDDEIFRIGGDEFLVLCSGNTEEELLQKSNYLRNIMKDFSVLLAVGCVWRPHSPTSPADITKLFAEADEYMYEDKRKYYAGCSEL